MVAAIHSRSGGPILAADCCASISFHDDSATVHRDELQKVFALSPRLAVAYSSDDVLAVHQLLRHLPDIEDEVTRALASGPDGLAAVFAGLAEKHAPDATILLGVIVAPEDEAPHLFTWDSRTPFGASMVPAGESRVLGSGSGVEELVKAAAHSACVEGADHLAACAIFADLYTGIYHDQHCTLTTLGVGGLVHFCVVAENGCVAYSDTEYAAMYSNDGLNYFVSMHYDESAGTWCQRRTDGQVVPVVNGLEVSFLPVGEDLLLLHVGAKP